MPVTATAQPSNIPPRVQIDVTGVTVSTTATVVRYDPDGRARPVRGAEPATLVAGAWNGYDYEAPYGVPVTYGVVADQFNVQLLTGADYEDGSVPAGAAGYFGSTPAIVTPGQDSPSALGITTNSATNPQGMTHTAAAGTNVPANQNVRCSAWVFGPAGQTFAFAGRAVNTSTGTQYTEAGGAISFVANGDWQWVTTPAWTWAANDYRPGAQLRLQSGFVASGVTFKWDRVRVERPGPVSSPVTLTATDLWLIHPGLPGLSVRVAPSNVTAVEDRSRAARSAVHQPLGRPTPIVVSESRASVQSGLTVLTDTVADRSAMWGLLDSGVALLLNVPPALGWGITWEYVSVGDVTEGFVAGANAARLFSLPYTVVDRPAGAPAAAWSYAGVMGVYPSFTDVLVFADYAHLYANNTGS